MSSLNWCAPLALGDGNVCVPCARTEPILESGEHRANVKTRGPKEPRLLSLDSFIFKFPICLIHFHMLSKEIYLGYNLQGFLKYVPSYLIII